MEKTIILATKNPGKLARVFDFFSNAGLRVLTLRDIWQDGQIPDIEENGSSFLENARIKATGYFNLSGGKIPTLADDAGVTVEALNGEPGVKTRRWIGREMTDKEFVDELLRRLEGVPDEKRAARMWAAMTFYDGHQFIEGTAYIDGYIASEYPKEISPGVPLRWMFRLKHIPKLYGELTAEEHELYNHRLDLLRRLKQFILSVYSR